MRYVQFKDIKYKFPKDSWLYWRNEKHDGEFDENWVIYVEDTFEVENLNLDDPFTIFNAIENLTDINQEACMAVLIDGNFKAENIYNNESDGSICLCVLGNLDADNMIIGGQELYITGNLNIKECFWGNYNHGDLIVKGETKTRVFVATEGYHYDYKKERVTAEFFLCDEEEEDGIFDRTFPEAVFSEEILYTEDEVEEDDLFTWNAWLSRSEAIKMLEKNDSIIKKDIHVISKEEQKNTELSSIPKCFENTVFNGFSSFILQLDNFHKLMNIVKLHKEEYQYYTFEDYEVQLHPDTEEGQAHAMFTHSSGFVFFICVVENENKGEVLSAVYRENGESSFINVFQQGTTLHYITSLNILWNDLLTRAERGAYFYNKFLETVKPIEIISFLNLPIVQEKYNDYKDADKNNFWYGGYCFLMRRHGERGLAGSIDIGKEREAETFDMRTYCFRPDELDRPQKCNLFYASSQEGLANDSYSGNGEVFKVFLYDWELFRESTEWYPKVGKAFTAINEEYLEEKNI
ncbi:hypothetical protein [Chryseobacterium sp. BIGb0232]|uniref:hypothetical protein n=1 Tax=Chryseobacterium sp. BIGb0232 TaxID=2940598 RepID=UPI000F901A8C|nr:hypothetical protein [Chryseobacterium sp. BIGb0232]MCS4305617.1 hypothetical protein [Chryseobacterium sp. BIGb0232]ROS20771.1 hypothetical protein EDF65_1504 [Chryseobacterium nakagawai]